MKRSLVIFDLNNILFRGCAINKEYNIDDSYTNGLLMFLWHLSSAVHDVEPTNIVVVNDSPPYTRKELCLDFKQGRKKDPELVARVNESRPLCLDFMKEFNITYWEVPGLEADDLMACMCWDERFLYYDIYLSSNDSDLYQLLCDSVYLYKGRKEGIYSLNDFYKEFNDLTPDELIDVLSISGTHNGLKGFAGYGPVKSLKLYRDKRAFNTFLEEGDNLSKFELYRKLVCLPLEKHEIPELKELNYSEDRFNSYLSSRNLTPTTYMYRAFDILKGY